MTNDAQHIALIEAKLTAAVEVNAELRKEILSINETQWRSENARERLEERLVIIESRR